MVNAAQLPSRLDELEHPLRSERADELPLQVGVAREEAVGAAAGALEPAQDVTLLGDVVEPGDADAAQPPQGPLDRLRAADRNDGDALGGEIAAAPGSERLDRDPVAGALDQDDRVRRHRPAACCSAPVEEDRPGADSADALYVAAVGAPRVRGEQLSRGLRVRHTHHEHRARAVEERPAERDHPALEERRP